MRRLPRTAFLVFVLIVFVRAGQAQPSDGETSFCRDKELRTVSLDTRGLGTLYCSTPPVLARPLIIIHRSARPVFFGAVPLAWAGTLLREGDDVSDAYRLTLAQGTTYGLVLGMKYTVGRPRPYVRRLLDSRSAHYGRTGSGENYTSFPSGHAAVSAALVTSWGLSHPEWYVVGPGALWAAGVSLSRLHLGVHYPSDVLAGTVLGVGVAILVHQARGILTPDAIQSGTGAPTPLTLRMRF